jgi:hypothetical protein
VARGHALSSRPPRTPVKIRARERVGLARHLEGWQPAALAIFLAGSTALLAVPRPVDPIDLPEPRIDLRALERAAREDEELAAGADRERLDVDVLELGTAIFAYGEADAAGDDVALGRERRRVLDAAQRAAKVGAPALLALRAHHLRSFLREIRGWEQRGEESVKLGQVAGGFTRMVRRNGWVTALGAGERPRLLMDRAVLAASFKKHWNEITGLSGELFALSIDESRVFYRFLLQHPIRSQEGVTSAILQIGGRGPQAAASALEAERSLMGQYRLKKLGELAAEDPSFPVHLARGVVLYQLQRYPLAVEAFRRHLEVAPDGPLTLRAQNYLRAALVRAREE